MRASQRYDFETKQWVPIEDSAPIELHYVQDDIPEFRTSSGRQVRGRAEWREHLARTGTIELGRSDIQRSEENWHKRKAQMKERVKSEPAVREAEPPQEIRPYERSRANKELRNRLEGRPMPDRKRLIKLAFDMERIYGGKR